MSSRISKFVKDKIIAIIRYKEILLNSALQKVRTHNSCTGFFLALITVFILLICDPLPSLNGYEPKVDTLKSLIQWGLSRQLTHASLTLSALVGIFSMLRMKSKILQKWETQCAFTGFLIFLSYEYYKLINSFQIVSLWERKLPVDSRVKYLFQPDLLQQIFLSINDDFCRTIIITFIQSLGIAVIVFFLIRIYNHSLKLSST
jgi:hypothetical protein